MFVLTLVFILVLAVCACASIFDYKVIDADGNAVSLSKYKSAKAILIVNIASKCSFASSNYRGLREMYDNLHERGLEILAFPSNQFLDMEPGSNSEIQAFCKENGINFPVMAKINVNGPDADPLYKFLKRRTGSTEIRYNFVKILVVGGKPVKRFAYESLPSDFVSELLPYLDADPQATEEL